MKKATKNICRTIVRGKEMWIVHFTIAGGKRRKKYFESEAQAKVYLKNYNTAKQSAISDLALLSSNRLLDIRNALKKLPDGVLLEDIVEAYVNANSNIMTLGEAFKFYKKEMTKIKGVEPKLRIGKFFTDFKNWEDTSPDSVLIWLRKRGAPKTIKEYKSELSAFWDFCIRRNIVQASPFSKITGADLPSLERSDISIWDIPTLKMFFDFLKEKRPRFILWFAIACFAGIRREEINRLRLKMIDKAHKRIVMPYSITKTKDSWVMEDLPENLWKFLDTYGELPQISDSAFRRMTEAFEKWMTAKGEKFKWGHNICRHSFCTYHLSLYRLPAKTSMLLKHRNPDTMWQHYLAGLVDKKTAEAYFSILPS